jgi:hypothetical protein
VLDTVKEPVGSESVTEKDQQLLLTKKEQLTKKSEKDQRLLKIQH